MEKSKEGSKSIKTIVPIKGNLLEKIKKKLKRDGKQNNVITFILIHQISIT